MAIAGAMVVALLGAGAAHADGYCGPDPVGPRACAVPTNGAVTGTLTANFEHDYFVFYARRGTQLSLTITNDDDPACSISPDPLSYYCGVAWTELLNGRGQQLAQTASSEPVNGVPVSKSVSRILKRPGTYYAVVTGDPYIGTVFNGVPLPYTLAVNGSPKITWPHPCVVPKLRRHTHLGTAKRRLRKASCRVGKVRHVRSHRVPRGDVMRLRPKGGTIAAPGYKVRIVVSGRPRHHHGRHHHPHG